MWLLLLLLDILIILQSSAIYPEPWATLPVAAISKQQFYTVAARST